MLEIRRIEKEFCKRLKVYKKDIEDRWEEVDEYDIIEYRPSNKIINDYIDLWSVGAGYTLWIDPEVLCTLGCVDITIYYNKMFAVSKDRDGIFINQLPALKKMIDIFYGTPFSLQIKKIKGLEFVRYEVDIPKVFTNNFSELLVFTKILDECLHRVNKFVDND
ncbi:hypothetical protein [Enterococcus gilvus]|uniref:Uncharacterized protein n=1 Tax=Enterococcus gilvus ATCC BAA-350 TaxID=1158614 RepID=R2V1B5_9ENTE|nr:hypothetical protein [Enterococcus gilvus]EOI51506.1 hypothetical protein UKC_04181 [Enterococcus gilvus ATCC BAA-350]EOW77183.1 hypothetical protein I592_04159 [Enterococcus gilvus ATCC BAA-350]OJG41154.1 hypothetical protein RV02_GL001241 [Enterococcus gilvus]